MAHGNAHSNSFFISALGNSVGGFEQFFKHAPPEASTAFVTIHHLAPDHRLAKLVMCAARLTLLDREPFSIGRPDQPARVHVSISDNGIGLAEENLKRIFAPFKTSSRHRVSGHTYRPGLLTGRYDRAESEYRQEPTFHLRIPA